MLDLINEDDIYGRPTVNHFKLKYLIDKQNMQLSKAVNYYHKNRVHVGSDNLLTLIFSLLHVRELNDLSAVTRYALERGEELADVLDLTRDSNPGTHFKNVFTKTEAVCVVSASFDDIETSWRNMVPVKYLYYDGINGMYEHPLTSVDTTALLGIDFVVMAKMSWLMQKEMADSINDDNPFHQSIDEMVSRYIMTNMMHSRWECIYRNMLDVSNHSMLRLTMIDGKSPLVSIDFRSPMLKAIAEAVEEYRDKLWGHESVLSGFLGPHGLPLKETLPEYEGRLTANNHWLAILLVGGFYRSIYFMVPNEPAAEKYLERFKRANRYMKSARVYAKTPKPFKALLQADWDALGFQLEANK